MQSASLAKVMSRVPTCMRSTCLPTLTTQACYAVKHTDSQPSALLPTIKTVAEPCRSAMSAQQHELASSAVTHTCYQPSTLLSITQYSCTAMQKCLASKPACCVCHHSMLCVSSITPPACCNVSLFHYHALLLYAAGWLLGFAGTHWRLVSQPACTSKLCNAPHTLPTISALSLHTIQLHSHAKMPCWQSSMQQHAV